MRSRFTLALLEAGSGLLCAGISVALLQTLAHAQASSRPPASHTPVPSAPPALLGPRFDADRALLASARPIASYALSAVLDSASHTISARGTITWQNPSSSSVSELWLHLYLNAFKNDQTLFLRSPYGAGRGGVRARDYGYLDVKRLSAREMGGKDLWKGADKHSPGDPADQTDIRVSLPEPLSPGKVLTLDVEFVAKLPELIERTGHRGSFYFVAQWFPKLAKIEPDGSWVHFPFNPQSEFYADYGDYSIDLEVPERFIVGATGAKTSERVARGRRFLRFEAKSVHDFAWTAWDRYREHTERIDGTSVRILFPPGFNLAAERELEALRRVLPHFNHAYGRYPYSTLTVVHAPEWAAAANGMEYPTLISTGGPWYMPFSGVRALELVTTHELGHQWFYGLVASDEHAWPFLDEGINSYAELVMSDRAFGKGSMLDLLGLQVSSESGHRAIGASHASDEAIAIPAARFQNFSVLGTLVYSRTATLLRTLAKVYGEEKLDRALGRYARYYRFQHPAPRHFIAALREQLGDDAADNLERALFERGTVDYVIGDIVSAKVDKPAGIFDRDAGRETVLRDDSSPKLQYTSRVAVHRRGTLRFPVDVELYAQDGTREHRRWDGHGSWTSFDYTGPSPLVGAVVDPDFRVVLDDNLLNNSTAEGGASLARVRERATYWFELLSVFLGP